MTEQPITVYRAEDFSPDEPVLYIPEHAKGNHLHPDCETGRVSSVDVKTQTVFVRFTTGSTAAGCKPHQLI